MKKYLVFPLVMLMVISLAACNLPDASNPTETPISIDAAFTAAAQTVEAQFTANAQTQAAATPILTNTPLPPLTTSTPTLPAITNTPLKPVNTVQTCDVAEFVKDVTVEDGTNFDGGETFVKTWRIKNTGTCSWTPSYALLFASGEAMSGPSTVALTGNVNPGDTVDISVNLTAPSTKGAYTGNWKLRNAAGLSFAFIYVKINVDGDAVAPTNTPGGPTATSKPFAVEHVTFAATGGCSSFTATVKIEANGAGTVTYRWVRSDGVEDTTPHEALIYDKAGIQSVTYNWATTDSGAKWVDIYIDEPNHYQFGRAEFTCP